MKLKLKRHECCICNKTFYGLGNMASPLDNRPYVMCCHNCSETKVIPARIAELHGMLRVK